MRLEAIMTPAMGHSFFKAYGRALTGCFKENSLLLRAKIYNPDQSSICLFQIWSKKSAYQELKIKFSQEKFDQALKFKGFRLERAENFMDESVLQKEIDRLKHQQVIWQFVNDRLKKSWMAVGDPLKINREQKKETHK